MNPWVEPAGFDPGADDTDSAPARRSTGQSTTETMVVRLAVLGGTFSPYSTSRAVSGCSRPAHSGSETGPTAATPTMVVSLVLNGALPLVAYLLLCTHVPNDAEALANALAVPVAGTLTMFAWRRRVDAIGAVARLAGKRVPADPRATTGPTVILGATLVLHAATLTVC